MTKIIFADDEGLYEGDLSDPATRERLRKNGMLDEDGTITVNEHKRNVYDTPPSHGDE